MVTLIQLSRSANTGYVPPANTLSLGQLFVNYTDGTLYLKDGQGNLWFLQATLMPYSIQSVNVNGVTITATQGNTTLTFANDSTINITGNALSDTLSFSANVSAIAGPAFAQANNAYLQANAANNIAVAANSLALLALAQANAAYGQANSAYTEANTANAVAQIAYTQANTANTVAQNGLTLATTANTTANLAYFEANTANALAQSAFTQANLAYATANSALLEPYVNLTANIVFAAANLGSLIYCNVAGAGVLSVSMNTNSNVPIGLGGSQPTFTLVTGTARTGNTVISALPGVTIKLANTAVIGNVNVGASNVATVWHVDANSWIVSIP